MDWTTILKAQQTDFIQRLKSGDLLHCEKEGQHSELTVISGDRLKQLRDFCWDMANKFKQQSDVKNIFFNNMKGKLGEEVVKIRLGDFVTEIDYEKRIGGDGKIDFTLTSDSSIGIQVKTRYGYFDKVQWTIDREEIEKNAVLVCILCQEEFSEMEKEYGLIIAGFLPTNMIKSICDKTLVGIDELLYPGSLRGYLESFKFSTSYNSDKYIRLGDECIDNLDYQGAIYDYCHALHLRSNEGITYYTSDAIIYDKMGNARYTLGDYEGAINDFTRAMIINRNCRPPIIINPNYSSAYFGRGNTRYILGDYKGAINDFSQVINLDPKFAIAYYNRGATHLILGNKQGAIDDFNKAASIYKQENNFHDYNKTLEQLKSIQSDDVELKSVVGINYTRLRDLLAAEKWNEANWETEQIMLRVTNRNGWLREQDIEKFPCEDLSTIDQLWVKYSKGRFGFSVQSRIYQSLGGTREYNKEILEIFVNTLGWKTQTKNRNCEIGYLPYVWNWFKGVGIFYRIETCNILNLKSQIQNSTLPELDNTGFRPAIE